MEATVLGVLVLGGAASAHGERRHRGLLAVVREVLHDREAWTAVGAVDEGIAEPAIVWIEELANARVARGGVRRHDRAGSRRRFARRDSKSRYPRARHLHRLDRRDLRQARHRRDLAADGLRKRRERVGGAFDLDPHALRVVADEAGKLRAARDARHRGSKADPLHRPTYSQRVARAHESRSVLADGHSSQCDENWRIEIVDLDCVLTCGFALSTQSVHEPVISATGM